MSHHEGASASQKAAQLRQSAAELRAKADRVEAMAANWQAGADGEERTAKALRPLEGPNCHVLHDRLLDPGRSQVNLDHLVASAAGVYLIDSKNWSGSATVVGHTLRTTSAQGRNWSQDKVLDKLRETAARVATEAQAEVFPVLCLTSPNSSLFGEPIFIRGVFIVPVARLADWLLGRRRVVDPATCRNQAIRLAASFPSSTQPAFLSVPPRRRAQPPRSDRRPAPTRPAPVAKQKPRPRAWPRALVGLAALVLVLTSFGRGLWTGAAETLTNAWVHQLAKGLPKPRATNWTHPCSQISDAAIAKLLGHPVYRYQDGGYDVCTWGFQPKSATAPVVLRIQTGKLAQAQYVRGTKATYVDKGTLTELLVPQFVAIPGSSQPASRTTQPIAVILTWPASPKPPTTRSTVAALALETARHLPTGPGSTSLAAHP